MDRLFKKNKDKEKKKAKRIESEEKSLGKNIQKFFHYLGSTPTLQISYEDENFGNKSCESTQKAAKRIVEGGCLGW